MGHLVAYPQAHVVRPAAAQDAVQGRCVGGLQVPLRAGGEPDAEAERLIGQALLVDVDLAGRVGQFEEPGGVQAARPAAEDGDAAQPHAGAGSVGMGPAGLGPAVLRAAVLRAAVLRAAGSRRPMSRTWSAWPAGTMLE